MTVGPLGDLESALKSFVGRECTEALLGHGAMISLDFPAKDGEVSSTTPQVRWPTLLFACAWVLHAKAGVMSWRDEDALLTHGLKDLPGEVLTSIDLMAGGLGLRLQLGAATLLAVFDRDAGVDALTVYLEAGTYGVRRGSVVFEPN